MNEDLYIGFENYLNNEMLPEERIQFEQRLESDLEFRESFHLYKETTQFLGNRFSAESADFEKNLKSISSAYFNENQEKKSKVIAFKPWQYAVAASLVLFMGTWFFMQNGNPEYGDYSQHESAYFTERGAEDVNLKQAQDFFNKKDYKSAVLAFEKTQDLKNPELQYFYAIALIETDDFSKAEVFLNAVKEGTSVYKDKATWYLALSNLKQNKISECKSLLEQVPSDAEDFDKAQKLLKELN
ncbi:tetratricopeptide repeat protein [Flavobacterium sp.]|uniref:tetratricopeptide repeat protein n=1 Tax=Flavobacterium sp. TaxID=239 RepID=UPI0026320C93|nr:tetratricopeptide repeat protein [Flavobacterium sp.]